MSNLPFLAKVTVGTGKQLQVFLEDALDLLRPAFVPLVDTGLSLFAKEERPHATKK